MFNEIEDILKFKGIENIPRFLNPSEFDVESEYLLDNIESARDAYVKIVNAGEDISLIVDCDCDGYSSAAAIYQYTKLINPNIKINYYIHTKKQHGLKDYSGEENILKEICEDSSKLVIIPDAGTENAEECKILQDYGKEVIILDHHNILPRGNTAIIVNNQLSEKVTDKAMTGVGIVYKFMKVLDKYYDKSYADKFLDLVAFGMIGDSADMRNPQTRYLTLKGLKQMQDKVNMNLLLSRFVEESSFSMNNKVTLTGVGFYMCPLVNSMIRVGEYKDKVIMFEAMCNSTRRIERKKRGEGMVEMSIQEYTYRACTSTNNKQKRISDKSADAVSENIEALSLDKYPVLVCNAGDDVEKGMIGLIANKLASRYQRPCILMKRFHNVCRGSGRGYNKSEIADFNEWCNNTGLFEYTKGHSNAFGCEIKMENMNKLFELLSTMDAINEPTYHVLGEYVAENLNSQLVKNVAKYDYIWGGGIDEPLFVVKDLIINKYNIHLLGQKQNCIKFDYHNISFIKMVRSGNLVEEYKKIVETGNNIKFTVVGRFTFDFKTHKVPTMMIEDMMYEKSEKNVNVFGV